MKRVTQLDHRISGTIHRSDNIIATVLLYPLAAFFHPGLIWIAYLSIYILSLYSLKLTAVYILGTLCCLITTTLLKRIAKRYSPHNTGLGRNSD